MTVKIPLVTREAMIDAALARYQQAKQDPRAANWNDRVWCEVVVGAAVDELDARLALYSKAKPAQGFSAPAKLGSIDETGPTALGGPPEVLKDQAIAQGYTGEACPQCMNFRMKRTSTCLTCQDCGFNKGCD